MQLSKNAKIIIAGILAILVASCVGLFDNIFKSKAVSGFKELSTMKNTEQVSDTTKIPAEYTFYPDMQYDASGNLITKATPFGEWDYTNADTVDDTTLAQIKGIANIVWIDKDDHSYDGKIGMIYDNVGSYNGHTISLKVTYMGTTEDATTNGYGLIMYNNSLALRASAAPAYLKIKYEFLDAETGKAIDVKGYQGFEDLDVYQGFKIDNYDKIYYRSAAAENLKVANYGGELSDLIQSTIAGDLHDDPTDSAKIAYTFSGSEITFTWTTSRTYYKNNVPDKLYGLARCFKGLDKEQSIAQALATYYYVDASGNICEPTTEGATIKSAVVTLRTNSNKIVASDTKDPLKTISDTKGDALTKDVYTKDDKIYFSVIHEVPGEQASNYYKSYVLTDELDSALQTSVSDIKIYNDATKANVSDKFNITVTNQNNKTIVTATAKENSLNDSKFYATAYNMVIGVNVKANADLTNYYKDGYYNIPNTAKVSVNSTDKTSNEVVVKIKETPILAIEKNADKDNYNIGDDANYTVKVTQTTKNATAKNVAISDVLNDEKLSFVSNSFTIKDKDGNTVNNAQVTVNGNKYSIKTNSDLAYNEFFTVTYKVKLTDKSLAGKMINNTVTAMADNADTVEANETINVLEPVKNAPILSIDKNVDNTSVKVGDNVTYTVKVTQTAADATAENVVIKDTFDTNAASPTNIKIVNSKGLDVTTAEVINEASGFTIKTHANLEKNEYFLVSYTVSIPDELAGKVINNVATTQADNAQEVTDNAKITVVKPALAIEKTVNKKTYSIGEKATYTLKVSQTVKEAIAKNVVITDDFDNTAINPESITITDQNGNPVNSANITVDGNSFVINTNANLSYGEFFNIVYSAKLTDASLVGTEINNLATASANTCDTVKDNAKITVVEPTLEIVKNVNKTTFGTNDKAKYTLVVKQTKANGIAKNVVITDTLDTNLAKAENIKITDKNNSEVANAQITNTEKGFTINTNSDLAYDEFFTVTYDVSLANTELSGKNIVNVATAKADNAKEVQDTKTITISKPILDIKKKVDKEVYSTDATAKYTLVVKQTVENAIAKNVVITDTLDTNLAKAENIKITDKNNSEVANAQITNTEKGFTINTNSDLAYDEFFTVTYDVSLANTELSGKNIVNVATAKADNAKEVQDTKTITISKPILDIKKKVDKEVYSTDATAKYTLVVKQTVENAIAKNVVITDTLDTNLAKAENIKITDKNNSEVANAQITNTEKGFTINTNSDLAYDEFFTVTYDVSLANAQLSGKNLSNTATTQADNGDKKTDENIVTVTKPALEISKISNKKIYSTGEIAKYTLVVKQTVENAVAKNVVVSDDFNTTKISKPTNVKVVDMNGQVLNNAEITMTDKGFNIETNANLAYNEFFMITYDVGMLNAELSGIDIVNTAKTSAENANEVNVNNTVNVTIPKLAIKKDVNKTAFSSNETAQYKLVVTQTVENAIAKNVVITDSFDKENIVPRHVKVINSEGKELENVDVTITKNGFTINTASDLAYNEFFTVTYDAKLSNAKLVGETIKNTANAKADNADMVEDAKSITIGKPNLSIVKTSDKEVYGMNENANYTIKVTQTVKDAAAQNVVITDVFDNGNVSVIEDTIKVLDKNGEELKHAKIEKTEKGFTIKTNSDLAYNEFVTVTYTANLTNNKLLGATIKNTATVTSDNTPSKSTDKTIKVAKPVLSIEKTSDQAAYLLGSTAKYTVKVTQTTENTIAKQVVINDRLTTEDAKILKDSIKIVDGNGKEVSDVEIKTTANSYQIDTHKDLAYNESFVVTYNVDFSDSKLTDKDVKNIAGASSKTTDFVTVDHIVKISTDKKVVDKVNEEAKANGVIQTGNNLPIALFAVMAIMSMNGIGLAMYLKKRNK